jgi:hypothetical protein
MNFDYGSIGPGYKNPLEGSGSIKGDYDWGSFSKGVDWDQTPEVDRSGLFESLFDKAKSRDKYRSQVEQKARDEERRGSSWEGGFTPGGAQRVTEDASIYTPSQIAPFTVQGAQGSPGILSQVAGIAAPVVGMMGGPAAPFIAAGLGGVSRTGW